MLIYKKFNNEIVSILKSGGTGIIPTDTIYGIVGSALLPRTVERIYKIRRRNLQKPMIILLSSMSDIKLFGIVLGKTAKMMLNRNRTSVILQSRSKKFRYLDRGLRTLAFRLPKNKSLRNFISKTGPLVAPSANPENLPPAKNIEEAKKYFGDKVDFYIDGGIIKGKPSTLIEIKGEKVVTIRK